MLGGNPRERYHMALIVTAMGNLNAVGLAQTAHERILEKRGALDGISLLRYGGRLPNSN